MSNPTALADTQRRVRNVIHDLAMQRQCIATNLVDLGADDIEAFKHPEDGWIARDRIVEYWMLGGIIADLEAALEPEVNHG